MYQLSEHEVEIVAGDVKSAGINFSHLGYDLIDHLCCDIESRMTTGISFTQAYSQVKDDFGIKGLQQIQINTLMLIDKNYRIMKNSMKTIGVVSLVLMALGTIFKLLHLSGAVYLMIVSFFFTSLVFFPSILYLMYKEINKKQQAGLYVVAFLGGATFFVSILFKLFHWPGGSILITIGMLLIGLVLLPAILINRIKRSNMPPALILLGILPLIIIVIGLLCKLQHWPGAGILLSVGCMVLITLFVPAYYFIEIRKSENFRIDSIVGLIALSYFIIMSFLFHLNLTEKSFSDPEAQYRSYSYIVKTLDNENDKLLSNCDIESMQELNNATDVLCSKLDELIVTIVLINNDISEPEALAKLQSQHILSEPYDAVEFLRDENNEYKTINHLHNDIEAYIKNYKTITKNTSSDFRVDEFFSWYDFSPESHEFSSFRYETAFSALTQLSFWQYQVQLAQNMQLKKLVNLN